MVELNKSKQSGILSGKIIEKYMKFDYGDQIKININAPLKYRPGEIGAVCGMWYISQIETAIEFNLPINTLLYAVEYIDGSDCQVPEEYLILDIPYENFKDS